MQELHIKHTSSIKLYCDSKATCNITHNPILHDITKHVDVDRHFIKETLEAIIIRSQDQLTDVLT